MSTSLVALCAGHRVGVVERATNGTLSFQYDDAWRSARTATPISVSMPLAARRHGHEVVDAFLWGLLPDNRFVLERWASRFGVSASSAFHLLAEVGEECAGAVQFIAEQRAIQLLDLVSPAGGIEWLDESEIGARLAALRGDVSAWRRAGDLGQFSLAGAQPKTALHRVGDRYGIPSGAVPTTHILKPPLPELAGHAENEHLCLTLARAAGLAAARSEVRTFAGEIAIVVERFDRIDRDGRIERVHQEDLCQALAVHPARKYQSDGGPGPVEIAALLRDHSDAPAEDIQRFARALVFNWIIGGTDAHAKNYALLHAPGPSIRLAPLYDVASILPYDREDPRRTKLAMRVGHHYRLHEITENDWRRLADDLTLDTDALVIESHRQRATIRAALPPLVERARIDGLSPAATSMLELALTARLDALDQRFGSAALS